MTLHSHMEELLAGYALGSIDEDEQALVREHVRECESCAGALGRHLEVAAALSLAADEVSPPPGLRDRILDAALSEDRPLAIRAPWRQGPGRPRRNALKDRLPFVVLAAAAAALVLAMGGWNVYLQQRLSTVTAERSASQLRHGDLRSANGASVGAISYLAQDNLALVSFHGLTAPSGRVYELWVIDSTGRADPAGTFLPEGDGGKVVVIQRRISTSDTIAVTEEPPGGSRVPSGAPIFTGKVV